MRDLKILFLKTFQLGAKKTGKKSAFGGAKKVDKTAFKNASSAAERVEKEEKVNKRISRKIIIIFKGRPENGRWRSLSFYRSRGSLDL